MYIIMVTYKKSLAIVDQYLAAHRAFLDEGYKNDFFVVSGPRNPRIGGIIISQLKSRTQLEQIFKQDPFVIHEIADYEFIEFDPVKHHTDFLCFLKK